MMQELYEACFWLVLYSYWLYFYFQDDHAPYKPLHVSLAHLPKKKRKKGV